MYIGCFSLKHQTIHANYYELTDHLGNVRLTFADYKYETDGWKPRIKVLSKNDYYPFGMMIPENYYQDSTTTRFKVTERSRSVTAWNVKMR